MKFDSNKKFIQLYAQKASNDFIIEQLLDKERFTGEDIVELTKVEQLNFFIIDHLFSSWQGEIKNLKSPYFNYDADEVQKALQKLMNVLSKNILIPKNELGSLLQVGIENTLQYLINPADYLRHKIISKEDELNKFELLELTKFLRIYKTQIEKFKTGIEAVNDLNLTKEFVLDHLKDCFFELENEHTIKEYVAYFNKISPVETNEILQPTEIGYEMNDEKEAETESEEENTEENYFEEIANPKEEVESESTKEKIEPIDIQVKKENKSIAESFVQNKIIDVSSALSINQRYMFTNKLFGGSKEEMKNALEHLDNCSSYDEAINVLLDTYASKYDWDVDMDEVKELFLMVGNKFNKSLNKDDEL